MFMGLCTLLGWGGKTVTRYESHQVQDKTHDSILKKIDQDPEWFLSLLEDVKDKIVFQFISEISKKGYRSV